MLLSATTAGKKPREGFDFFPLTVDVEERMYAAGRIPGSFFRREGRPSEDAILTCRLIDRPLRPTFIKGLRNEVQVVITVMALNPDHAYDVLAINAASASTQISGLPFNGPVGGTRVALIDGQWVGFPTHTELERATFDMVVAGRVLDSRRRRDHDGRGRGHRGLARAHRRRRHQADRRGRGRGPRGGQAVHRRAVPRAERAGRRRAAKPVAEFPVFLDYSDEVYEAVEGEVSAELAGALTIADKQEREARLDEIKARVKAAARPSSSRPSSEISPAYRSLTKKLVRQRILRDKVRIDGRGLADIRTLSAEVEVIPRVHGSALFQRGETQILGVTTLNMLGLEQKLDTLRPSRTKRYMHNYNFPPYSTGETGRVGSPKRREIGHGALAERALVPVLPCARRVPLRHPAGVRGPRLERLDLDGLGLRLDAGPAQRRRAAQGAGRRHRDGPGVRHGRRQDRVRRADRHPRRRGRVRRHGLQGRRHEGVRHRAAARHQARRHPVRGAGRGAQRRPATPGCTSWTSWPRPSTARTR